MRDTRQIAAYDARVRVVSEESFRVVYEGPDLANGAMDVRTLAPSLLALGDLVHEVNRKVNGDAAKVSVQVKADFKAGSFGVDLQLVYSLVEQAQVGLLALQQSGAIDLLTILGFVGLDGPGLFRLIPFLKGAPPKHVERRRSGDTAVTNVENSTVIINNGTYLALMDPAVRQSAYAVVAPLERPGIDRVKIGKPGGGVVVEDEDVPYFASGIPESADKVMLDTTTEAILAVIRPDFSGSLMWTMSDGTSQFTCRIEDAAFLARVARREITFGANDSLRVQMRVVTHQRPAGTLSTTRTILAVLERIPGPSNTQMDLLGWPHEG